MFLEVEIGMATLCGWWDLVLRARYRYTRALEMPIHILFTNVRHKVREYLDFLPKHD